MKSNRVPGVGGIVLLVAFAMVISAQASTLSGVATLTGGSLSAAVVEPVGRFGISAISHAVNLPPEPATFVLVGITLALLPLIRKKRS